MKQKMKKLLSLAVAGAMVFSLAACGSSGSSSSSGSGDQSAAGSASGNAVQASTGGNTSEPQYGGEVTLYYPKFYDFWSRHD